MKSAFFFALVAGLASSAVDASSHVLKQSRRPQPSSEFMSYVQPSLKLDRVNLQELPATVSTLSARQSASGDFYECRQSVSLSFLITPFESVSSFSQPRG